MLAETLLLFATWRRCVSTARFARHSRVNIKLTTLLLRDGKPNQSNVFVHCEDNDWVHPFQEAHILCKLYGSDGVELFTSADALLCSAVLILFIVNAVLTLQVVSAVVWRRLKSLNITNHLLSRTHTSMGSSFPCQDRTFSFSYYCLRMRS